MLGKAFTQILRTSYSELTLFVLSLTCFLFFISGYQEIFGDGNFLPSFNGLPQIILTCVVLSGIALSFYHAFSNRRKNCLEKQIMFLFGALLNGFSGLWGSTYLLSKSEEFTWLLIFPAINCISSYLIIAQIRYRIADDDCIDDRNVFLREVALSTMIVVIAFIISKKYLHLHWAATLSICVAYGTNLNRGIVNLILRRKSCG